MYNLGYVLNDEKSNYCNAVCVPEDMHIVNCILFQPTRPSRIHRSDPVLVNLWRGNSLLVKDKLCFGLPLCYET